MIHKSMSLKYEPSSEPLHISQVQRKKNAKRRRPRLGRRRRRCGGGWGRNPNQTDTRNLIPEIRILMPETTGRPSERSAGGGGSQGTGGFFSSLLLSSLEMIDTQVYEP